MRHIPRNHRHLQADQTVVKKRKTELGGAFTVANRILFIGLLVSLLYQIIATIGVEVSSIRPTNAPDLVSFTNDVDSNITTISSMSCSQLHGPHTIVTDSPGSIDYNIVPFANFAIYSCHNSSKGPIIALRCQHCPLTYENVYVSWQFFNITNKFPATAVGLHFNLTTKNYVGGKIYANFVSGTINDGVKLDHKSVTYRGANTHVLKFNLFPRVHHNLHGLELLQPAFHAFRPGSLARDEHELRSLLESPNKGLINITLALHFLSEYMIEVDDRMYIGSVSFLADIDGLCCLSFTLFLLLLTLCESRIKRLRTEDEVMQNIRKRRIVEDHWNKVYKDLSRMNKGVQIINSFFLELPLLKRSLYCFYKQDILDTYDDDNFLSCDATEFKRGMQMRSECKLFKFGKFFKA
ncbi:uncharacterized protein LOC130802434 [Amaranthus tricolor]|uniref:uncharacterized protein LOC130802434 n=1 Tax=Amaranthus tricolor TaxID=29722 RepID=UPI0025889446|nr:uncharacterized protein LOC130802434 [Amaranthus tricolor]